MLFEQAALDLFAVAAYLCLPRLHDGAVKIFRLGGPFAAVAGAAE